mgnify:CR=1 FL=1
MKNKILIMPLFLSIILVGCGGEKVDPSTYHFSPAQYAELERTVGCDSKYSDDKKDDIFKEKYEKRWMEWSGEVYTAYKEKISMQIDGEGTQDLLVFFADEKSGYDLNEGDRVTVRFVMTYAGGCFLPYTGKHAILKSQPPSQRSK